MLTAIVPDRPISAASQAETARPVVERAVMPVAPPTPVEPAQSQLAERQPQPKAPPPPQSGALFAAAVLSGALLPRPATLSQLYARIGASTIPEESELRLRDLEV